MSRPSRDLRRPRFPRDRSIQRRDSNQPIKPRKLLCQSPHPLSTEQREAIRLRPPKQRDRRSPQTVFGGGVIDRFEHLRAHAFDAVKFPGASGGNEIGQGGDAVLGVEGFSGLGAEPRDEQ